MDLKELDILIDKNKKIIDTLPINTIDNRNKKIEYLKKEILSLEKMKTETYNEIKSRYLKFDKINENKEISILKQKVNISLFNELNHYNTPYEKMHLDYYLYLLHRYYKDDLESVNNCLYSLLDAYKNVGIELSEKDFNYHPYAREYMDAIINHKDDGSYIHDVFEKIYWKCSNIIVILEMNFKHFYYKNLKSIEKFYNEKRIKILENHTEDELYNMYYDTMSKIKSLENIDCYTILQKFVNKKVLLSDVNIENIEKKKKRIFKETPVDELSVLEKLYNSLEEYEWYNKYQYIIEDMREKIKEKDQYKGKFELKLKEIEKQEKQLFDINIRYEKNNKPKRFFNKEKKDEKLVFQLQNTLNNLEELYLELDDIKYNDLVLNKLSIDSSISEILKMASSSYLYFVKLKKIQTETINIKEVTDEYSTFIHLTDNFPFTLLNNIYILEEKDVAEIISDRYLLLNVALEKNDLEADNLESVKKDVHDLIFANNLSRTNLSVNDIEFYLEIKKDIDFSEENQFN